MRLVVDLATHILGDPKIIQVEKTPPLNNLTAMNGKYVIPIPEGTDLEIDTTSVVVPMSGTAVSSLAYANLLAQHTEFNHVYFNPLLTKEDVGQMDLSGSFVDPILGVSMEVRAQSGRPGTDPNEGQAPGSTAALAANDAMNPVRPGSILTIPISIAVATSGVGSDNFLVWWKIYEYETTQDIRSSYGKHANTNSPAIRSIKEVNQEPNDFKVYFTSDDHCDSWISVRRRVPFGLCEKTNAFRLLFINDNVTTKRYIATYGVLFK